VAMHTTTSRHTIELHTRANTPMSGSHSHSADNASATVKLTDVSDKKLYKLAAT